MLRNRNHEEVKRLKHLQKAFEIVKARNEVLNQFFENMSPYDEADKETLSEYNDVGEVLEFLHAEIEELESSTGLNVIRKTKDLFGAYKQYVNSALFDMTHDKEKFYFWNKYKDDEDVLHTLYLSSLIHQKIFDVLHFQELVKYFDDDRKMTDAKEAIFEFKILGDKEGNKDHNSYHVLITCDNDLTFEVLVNSNWEYETQKIYTRDYEKDYSFSGTCIRDLVHIFNLLKMMKTITTTGKENKTYKLYLK